MSSAFSLVSATSCRTISTLGLMAFIFSAAESSFLSPPLTQRVLCRSQVVVLQDVECVLAGERHFVPHNLHVGVDGLHFLRGGIQFLAAHVGGGVDHLALD